MTRLKDLAGRAGKWLGLATPPALHTRAIQADRFDVMEWREVYDQATALQAMADELADTHDYAADLLADVWTAAYKTAPHLRGRDEMEPSRMVNHQVMAALLEAPEFAELHRETAGDAYAAAMAVISQRERLSQMLERAESAARAAQEAEQARRQAAEAAQRLAAALEEATDQANQTGQDAEQAAAGDLQNDPQSGDQDQDREQDGAQEQAAAAVEAAIADAEAAANDAQAAAEHARQELAQATPAIRAAVRRAAADAAAQARQEAALMAAWGIEPGRLQRMDFTTRAELAQRLRGGRLGRFADLIGRFRTMATGERARHIEHAPGELVGITLGDDLGRLIPSELASLGVPAMRAVFAARLAEGRLMTYETRGEERTGKGAIIACIDCSGSMGWGVGPEGHTGEAWAKACALALLDQARNAHPRRDFAALLFSSPGELHTIHFPAARPTAIEDVIELAEHFFGGGTDYQTPLDAAAELLEAEHNATGRQRGDIVLITDGECEVSEDWMRRWNETKARLGHRLFGIAVGHQPSPVLEALADNLHTVTDLTDPGATRDIFRVI